MNGNIHGLLKHAATAIGSIVVIVGFAWTIGEPMAQDVIRKTVKEQGFAKAFEVQNLRGMVTQNTQASQQMQLRSIQIETDVRNIKELTKETRQDIKAILRALQTRP